MPFCCFDACFEEIHREHFFLDIKLAIAERSIEILRNFFFLPCLNGINPEKNLDLFKQLSLIKPLKGNKY